MMVGNQNTPKIEPGLFVAPAFDCENCGHQAVPLDEIGRCTVCNLLTCINCGLDGDCDPKCEPRMVELTALVGPRAYKEFVKSRKMGHMRTAVPYKDFRVPNRAQVYAIDNGKFAVDRKKKTWDEAQFLRALAKVPKNDPRLLFVVVPDIVEGGNESLEFSKTWRSRIDAAGFGWMPLALAVQDGMDEKLVDKELETGRYAFIFIGGSKPFKYETTWCWVDKAHRRFRIRCHLAGIYLPEDQAWARARRVDSIDSTGWARNNAFDKIDEGRALREHQTRISEALA